MPIVALNENYRGEVRDSADKFSGKKVIFVEWQDHLRFCSPIALLVDENITIKSFIKDVLGSSSFANHADWNEIDWSKAEWVFKQNHIDLNEESTFESAGIGHKALISLRTPVLLNS